MSCTLKEIVDSPIAGNHFHDMPLFNKIDEFVQNGSNSMSDRVKALHHMSINVMGCSIENDIGKTDAQIVQEYLDEC